MNRVNAALSLGMRVVLAQPIPGYPAGRSGRLISLQAGTEPGAVGVYATVNFDLSDWSIEENVPLVALRDMPVRG